MNEPLTRTPPAGEARPFVLPVAQALRWQALIATSAIFMLLLVLVVLSYMMTTNEIPEAGGHYIEGVVGQPGNLNPLFAQNRTDADVVALVFEPLTRVAVDGTIEPNLATRWTISPDEKTYTFTLRRDVRWHDGTPFTADDVAYTISVLVDPSYTSRPAISEVWSTVRVEVVNPYTIRFQLPQPYAPFLSFTTFSPIPRHLLDNYPVADLPNSPFSQTPIGNGRWQVETIASDVITLVPAPTYFGEPPMLSQLVLRFYPSAPAVLQAYQRGEVTGVSQIQPRDLTEVLQESQLQLQSATLPGLTMVTLNLRRPLFADVRVRQALLLALDRPKLIADVLSGQAIPAHSFIVPSNWAYNPGIRQYPFNPDGARELLSAAGWVDSDGDGIREKDGQQLGFTLLTNEEESRQLQLTNAIAAQWATVGISTTVQVLNFSALTGDALRPRNFDAAVVSVAELPLDPDPYPLFHSTQTTPEGGNYSGFGSERSDRLLVEARRKVDPELRREAYFDFQEIFAEELPLLPISHPVYSYAVDTRVRNIQIGPLHKPSDRFFTVSDWYIKTKRLVELNANATPGSRATPTAR